MTLLITLAAILVPDRVWAQTPVATPAAPAATTNKVTPTNDSYYLGDGALTLTRALETDKDILTIENSEPLDLTTNALIYPDPNHGLSASTIASKYLSGERPRLNMHHFLSYEQPGTTLWLLIPLYNRTGETQWMINFGHRLTGRTLQLAALQIIDLTDNRVFFNQGENQVRSGFLDTGYFSQTQRRISLSLKPNSRHLLLIKLTPNAVTSILTPLQLVSPNVSEALPFWQQRNFYLSSAFFITGLIFSLVLLAARFSIATLALYIISLAAVVLYTLPLLDPASVIARGFVVLQAVAGLWLSLGLCALARLTSMKLAWSVVQSTVVVIHLALIGMAAMGPAIYLNHPAFLLLSVLPVLLLSLGLGMMLLRDADGNGMLFCVLGLLHVVAFSLQNLTTTQIFPPSLFGLNAVLFSLFLSGPLILLLLHRVNIFAEAIEISKHRKRSLNDEEQLARLRNAKDNFDYNNLLKVIEHERRQLADARARESLRSDEMRKAKEQADEANRAKSAFLAVISHEIRTPMTGIMGMVKLLLDSTLNRSQNEFVMTIKESGNAMMGLLNDILDFEKIESGKMQLETLDFDLHRLISGVATLMNGHAMTKGIELNVNVDASVPQYVLGDVTRLRQVLLNLVGNAIKFTKSGSVTIKLSATRNENEETKEHSYQIYFAVVDTGIGISSEAQKNIFNPFAQADKTIARKFGGSGLGLAISKRLIEAMGSQINIKSREGEGTTFFFSLNMKEGDASIADESLNKANPNRVNNKKRAETLPKLRIMIVEDNTITQRVVRTMIEQGQHEVLVCASAEEALPYLQMGERFDLILSDIQMQGMSGHEFVRKVRVLEDPISRATPVYALTGNVDDADIQTCLDAGMNGHLAKPIDPDILEALLITVAEHRNEGKPLEGGAPLQGTADKSAPRMGGARVTDPELELIGTLRESLGDEQVQQLLNGLYSKAEEIISILTTQNDMPIGTIRERAHELKGMCGNFGMMNLSDLAKQIEKQAKEGIHEGLIALINKLPTTYQTGRQKIQDWMGR